MSHTHVEYVPGNMAPLHPDALMPADGEKTNIEKYKKLKQSSEQVGNEKPEMSSEKARATPLVSVSIFGSIVFGTCALVYQYMMNTERIENLLTLKCKNF